jgi:protein CpxP
MKKNAVKFLVMMLAMTAFSLAAAAQSDSQQGEKQGHARHGGMMHMSVEERLQRMTKMLNLTDDQQAKIRPILEDQQKQAMALRDNTSLSQDDKRAKFQQMHEDSKEKIRAVLTDEQKAKFDQLHSEHKGMHKHGEKGESEASPKQ